MIQHLGYCRAIRFGIVFLIFFFFLSNFDKISFLSKVILCEAGGTCGNLWLDIENNKTMRFSGTNTKQDYVILSTGGEMLFQEISKVYKEIIHSSNLSELI